MPTGRNPEFSFPFDLAAAAAATATTVAATAARTSFHSSARLRATDEKDLGREPRCKSVNEHGKGAIDAGGGGSGGGQSKSEP